MAVQKRGKAKLERCGRWPHCCEWPGRNEAKHVWSQCILKRGCCQKCNREPRVVALFSFVQPFAGVS